MTAEVLSPLSPLFPLFPFSPRAMLNGMLNPLPPRLCRKFPCEMLLLLPGKEEPMYPELFPP